MTDLQKPNTLSQVIFAKRPVLTFFTHWGTWQLLHLIVFLPTLVNSKIFTQFFLFNHIILVFINFLLFYIVAFYIMPRMGLQKKKWAWVVIASLLLAILFTYFKFRLQWYHTDYLLQHNPGYQRMFKNKIPAEPQGFFSYLFRTYFQTNILTNVSIVIVAFAYRLSVNWYQQEKIRKELENQRLRAELSYLKMQVNPHFLFNALNNIYSLAVIENSKRTGDSIMKLSDLMRYVLYEKEDEEHKVRLDNEIRHINSYIDLERLRHEGELYVNFSIEGEPSTCRIAPLLLFPLIENAFKHGIRGVAEKPINIELKITGKHLEFYIQNYKNEYMKDKVGGIGIQNVRKRLNLLYPNQYTLDVKETDDQFFVKLQLPL
ncbi:sensor histidine kinase [Flavisolibacter tropicus]|uniref:sensor histidine kinase n=1 Tax=Flavisolibacter tropicus TaxID=1492898 RepID=UPI00082FB863|nr:histidine kinase [Flavisolibacter tropicus]